MVVVGSTSGVLGPPPVGTTGGEAVVGHPSGRSCVGINVDKKEVVVERLGWIIVENGAN